MNHHPQAIESAIENAQIPGIKASWIVVFGYRPIVRGRAVETVYMAVIYAPNYALADMQARFDTLKAISKTVVLFTGIRPCKVLPVPETILSKSVLGKLSRSQIKSVFLQNGYYQFEKHNQKLIAEYQKTRQPPNTTTELCSTLPMSSACGRG